MMAPPLTGIPTSWINTILLSLDWLIKYTVHMYVPISYKGLAKYTDKHITREESCNRKVCFVFEWSAYFTGVRGSKPYNYAADIILFLD